MKISKQKTRKSASVLLAVLLMSGSFFVGAHALHAGTHPAVVVQKGSADAMAVNINTADLQELQTIKGIGPSLAERIIRYREENGAFQDPEDLEGVRGLGPTRLRQMKKQIKF